MTSAEIRRQFLEYFKAKGHKIYPSAPVVLKNDPTLMFTNAGMNQFKDYFLGNQEATDTRIADTQKCLRVSGKHNDLEDVGYDSYHHTLFEMLGNWSFGDYFKEEAIHYAWELLTEVYKIDKDRLYVTIFEGNAEENVPFDNEAKQVWLKYTSEDRILPFGKKDNFWEMGETGPSGPSSEIHIDMREASERKKFPGAAFVNKDHPDVIEIWNLVFIQYNRKADGSLEPLPAKHVDTGMGFERLVRILQNKKATYDTDIFAPFIQEIEKQSRKTYTGSFDPHQKTDVAMRVIVDHIRAVAFTIADGELPSNTGAGYVIRRILRRAVRYYYSFLDINEPFMYSFIPMLAKQFEDVFPELQAQVDFVTKVVQEEERSFLRTLDSGIKRFEALTIYDSEISGEDAFELYDTFGFPIDLTRLMAREKGYSVDEAAFEKALEEQKQRSRASAAQKVGDWTILAENTTTEFVGYDQLHVDHVLVQKYRTVTRKDGPQYQLVLDKTPFYPEGGGQVGDTGVLKFGDEVVSVLNTKRENDLILHFVDHFPQGITKPAQAQIDRERRALTEDNHTATHLMHAALRQVLGDHVQQKGSLVNDQMLRFDFSHFSKMTDDEIAQVEHIVNVRIRENIPRSESRSIPIEEAKSAGAMMLFGEKYGDEVRMISFDPSYSVELCGGCHVQMTGQIGSFKIISESAVAAGVRRIVAVTAQAAEDYVNEQVQELRSVKAKLKNPVNIIKSIDQVLAENRALKKEIETLNIERANQLNSTLESEFVDVKGVSVLAKRVDLGDAKAIKTLAFELEKSNSPSVVVLTDIVNEKPLVTIVIAEELTKVPGLHAGQMVRTLASLIKGGGGGQPFFATAGGSDSEGLDKVLAQAVEMVSEKL